MFTNARRHMLGFPPWLVPLMLWDRQEQSFKWRKRNWMFSNIREHTWPGHWLYIWSDLQRLSHAKYPLTSGPLQLATLSARNSTFWLTHTLHSLDRPFSAVLNLFKPYSLFLYPALISMVALKLPHIILSFYVLYFSLLIQPSTLQEDPLQ